MFQVYAIKECIFIYKEHLPFPEKTENVEHKKRRGIQARENVFNSLKQDKLTIASRQIVTKTLRCGLSYEVTPRLVKKDNRWIAEFKYEFDPFAVSKFLSRTFETPIDYVVEGDLLNVS